MMCLRIARHRNAPVEGGARDRQILQAALHEARDLVQPLLRQHEIRDARVEVEQLVLIGGQPEEIALLLDPLDRRAGFDREPRPLLVQAGLVLGVIGFVAHRIPAGIFVEIDVAVGFCIVSQIAFDDAWWRSSVVRMKSSFEQFIRSTMAWKRGTLRSSNSRAVSPSRAAVCWIFWPCSSVPVRKIHVVAVEPHEARDRVGRDRLIGVTDMRHAVRIGDRGRDVIARPTVRLALLLPHRSWRWQALESLKARWRSACFSGLPPSPCCRFSWTFSWTLSWARAS